MNVNGTAMSSVQQPAKHLTVSELIFLKSSLNAAQYSDSFRLSAVLLNLIIILYGYVEFCD